MKSVLLVRSIGMVILIGCTSAPTTTPIPTVIPATILATATPEPTRTETLTQTLTPSVTATASPPIAVAREIKTLDTRPGITMRMALLSPNRQTQTALIIYPGGDGRNHFQLAAGTVQLGGNFLVRTAPEFASTPFFVAIVDVPSDRSSGMNGAFRISLQHRQDTEKTIEYLASQGFPSIYLVGTSAGTVSVAALAANLNDNHIKGYVLTSTLAGNEFVGGYALERVTRPVLIVHHRDDGCTASRFQDAVALKAKFVNSPRVDFVEVRGGTPPRSDPCEPFSQHGYFGVEAPVVQMITDWLLGKTVPFMIGN